VGQYATQWNFLVRWLPRGISHLRLTETPKKRQSNHIFRPVFRTCCRATWFAALNHRYGHPAPRRCRSPIPAPQPGISNVSTPRKGEAPAEPQTQRPTEHLSASPYCQPTTKPCLQLIAIWNHPAKQLRRSPSTGSRSSPAIRGLSGIWAHRPTASSPSPRGCGDGGGASLRVTGHWGGACPRAGTGGHVSSRSRRYPDNRNVEILHRLTPATRHWATQSIHLLTACLTRMQLLPPLTPVPAANPGSRFGSSFGTGPNIGHHAAGPLQSQSAAGLPAATM
jgi:hypothetical protein